MNERDKKAALAIALIIPALLMLSGSSLLSFLPSVTPRQLVGVTVTQAVTSELTDLDY